MGPIAKAFSVKSGSTMDILRALVAGNATASGKSVNLSNALQVSAVCSCVRVIGEGIAQVPLKLMQQSEDGKTRLPAKRHPLYEVLAHKPNEWQTSFEYRETIAMHAVLAGNHFSFINRSSRLGIMELIPFDPGSVRVIRSDNYDLTYEVTGNNGSKQIFPAESIWHIKGPSWNSWMGLDAVRLAREAIGLAMSTEDHQASMQKNGARASGVYSVDGVLKDDQYKALKAWIDENIGGSKNSGSVMLLDRNAKFTQTSMTGIDAQTLETRRYQVEEICRFFRVNPIMVGAESKNTTYASAEQMFLAHVVHCLSPWYTRIEQSIDANLLTKDERESGLYSAFIDDGLLRGSMMNKKDVILGYVNGGLMYPNEGRALLDLNPDPDPKSDQLRVPSNVAGLPAKPQEEVANDNPKA
jgi:HK97 family phage portal protein